MVKSGANNIEMPRLLFQYRIHVCHESKSELFFCHHQKHVVAVVEVFQLGLTLDVKKLIKSDYLIVQFLYVNVSFLCTCQ